MDALHDIACKAGTGGKYMCAYAVVLLAIGLQSRETTAQDLDNETEDVSRYRFRKLFRPYRPGWDEAVEACRANGMQLLTVKSAAKNDLLGGNRSWIALREGDDKTWKWHDGTEVEYSSWFIGNSDLNPEGSCAFRLRDGSWFDQNCDEGFSYLCEYYADDPCFTVQCVNATCRADNETFVCECPPGFDGVLCEEAITSTISTTPSPGSTDPADASELAASTDLKCDCDASVIALVVFMVCLWIVDIILVVYIVRVRKNRVEAISDDQSYFNKEKAYAIEHPDSPKFNKPRPSRHLHPPSSYRGYQHESGSQRGSAAHMSHHDNHNWGFSVETINMDNN